MDRNEEGKGTGMKRINGQERRGERDRNEEGKWTGRSWERDRKDEGRGPEIREKICGQ